MKALTAPDNQHRPPVTVTSKGLFTCRTNEWATPQSLFDALKQEFDFDLDVAARLTNAKCKHFFTKKQNGLEQDWFKNSKTKFIFCNPPFQGQTAKWVEKAYEQSLKGCTVVVLIPFRSDTSYIHEFVIGKASEIRLIKGRLKYNDGAGSAPFPSSIIIFNPNKHSTKWLSVDKENNELSGIIKFKADITYNTTRTYKSGKKAPNGIEIRFGSARPTEELRTKLKEHGFQFSEKQTIWYAIDTPKARELAEFMETNEVDVDDTQYEKRYLWVRVGSMDFYNKLTNYTEFMVSGTPPKFYRNKKQLASATNINTLVYSDQLKFKKFYNKIIGEDGEESETEEQENENNEEESEAETENKPSANKPNKELAEKFKTLAQGMQKTIDAKLNSATSRQRPTAKRLRVASGMRQEGYYLQNIQKVLFALSESYSQGKINDYPYLKHIRSKSQVELINKYADTYGRKHEDHYLTSVLKNQSKEFQQLDITSVFYWSLAYNEAQELIQHFFLNTPAHTTSEHQRQIEELEIKIKSKKIEGFFPTPKKLIDELIRLAEIKKGDKILEPSAGKGDILDAIKAKYGDTVNLSACEIHYELRELLTLKGYEIAGSDFLNHLKVYDKIIMNPPFEKGQDIDHLLHALMLLHKGGRLVAIMSEGVFFRNFKKEKEFRDKLFQVNAYISDRIQGAFKDAFNQTGVAVRIVVINQDGTLPEFSETEDEDDVEESETQQQETETDQLELEALAEMELLKMELELKKKKQNLNGLGEINGTDIYPAVWDIH